MKAIFKREVNSYFESMTGYVFIAFLVAAVGIYFYMINLRDGYPYFSITLNNILFIYMVAIPVLTMRSMAEEKRSKTDQLLLTSPVSPTGIVLGKYFAMLYVLIIPTIIFCICPVLISLTGNAYFAADYVGILTFFLLGALYIAIGMFISSLCDNQMVAFICTFLVLLVFYLWDTVIGIIPASSAASLIGLIILFAVGAFIIYHFTKSLYISGGIFFAACAVCAVVYALTPGSFENLLVKVLGSFSLVSVMNNVAVYNVLDIKGIVLYLSLTALMLYYSVETLKKRRQG